MTRTSAAAAKIGAAPRHDLIIQQALKVSKELTEDLRRLLLVCHEQDRTLGVLGLDLASAAAHLSERIPAAGGALFTASSADRLKGALYLEPELLQSALFGQHMWKVQHLLLDPGAPEGTVEALLGCALAFLRSPVDFLSVRVPATDGTAIRGLHQAGFRTVAGEAVGTLVDPKPARFRVPGMTIVPLQADHLDAAAKIARDCHDCQPYGHDPGFDAGRISTFLARSLAAYIKDPFRAASVALDRAGEILGVVAFTVSLDLGESIQRRIGILDLLCVRPSARSLGLGEILQRHALGALAAESIDAVLTRTLVNCPGSLDRLETLQKLGFQITASNLLMHRWLQVYETQAA
jgi:GNAT superfamily N-acetyltransferase